MGKRHRSGRRVAQVRKQRRETVYKMKRKRCYGVVPCFVCGQHVDEMHATLEHVQPLSKGGTDAMANLDISHSWCNQARGNADGR
ncbi:HNH endonuclease [Roseateles sp. DXS20W]|uniref:HNH endonuclease n=1 Tax=Pelomonas lactea TaxID=3299030 RepID=A0ABW7GK22_9BURK